MGKRKLEDDRGVPIKKLKTIEEALADTIDEEVFDPKSEIPTKRTPPFR